MNADQLKALLAKAEFHKFLALDLIAVDASGSLTLKLTFRDEYTIFKEAGNYHGGVIASLVDIAGAMACSILKSHPTPTSNLRIDYLKSPSHCDLYADAEARRVGRSLGVADVTIRDRDGSIYALGRGSFCTAGPGPFS